ncbi:MAG: type pilus assembly protein PilC [Halanaerobiales bacterium]|nr:type pilus assembly protein PilC [Halanaerobiales bacterium]
MAPVFNYEAKDKHGKKIAGSITADEASKVASQLRKQGYYITSIEKGTESKRDIKDIIKFNNRVKTSDLAVFSQQFSVLINAGISLVDSLEIMQEQTENAKLKEVLARVQEDIEAGSSLSEAMLRYPKVFPEFYCQMIRAGEAGGMLDHVLVNLAGHYQRQNEIGQKVKSALYYPVIVLVVAIVIIVFLIISVLPNFVNIYAGFGAELPLLTRIFLEFGGFMQKYWWLVFGIIIAIILTLKRYSKTPSGKYKYDRIMLKLPVIGKIMQKIVISRFASTLSILLDSGVNLLESLAVVEEVVGNQVIAKVLIRARGRLREGTNISDPLAESGEFPKMVVQMLKVGEESGAIDEMLKKVAEFYDREVETAVEGIVSLIEPVLIIFLALIVGFIALAIILPVLNMYSIIG